MQEKRNLCASPTAQPEANSRWKLHLLKRLKQPELLAKGPKDQQSRHWTLFSRSKPTEVALKGDRTTSRSRLKMAAKAGTPTVQLDPVNSLWLQVKHKSTCELYFFSPYMPNKSFDSGPYLITSNSEIISKGIPARFTFSFKKFVM